MVPEETTRALELGELLGSVRAAFSQPLVVFVVVFLSSLLWLIVYVALHEVAWCMVVWCTQNAPRRQQFHMALAISAVSTPLRWIVKNALKKLFTHAESHASAVSLLESGEKRYIKAINNNNK